MELVNIGDCESPAEMLAGSSPVAYPLKTYKVKRGFEMRFHPDEYFKLELYLIPKGVDLYDGCLYYIDYGKGEPLVECYNRKSSEKYDMYQCEPWEETVKHYEEMDRKFRDSLPKAPKFKERFNRIFNQ